MLIMLPLLAMQYCTNNIPGIHWEYIDYELLLVPWEESAAIFVLDATTLYDNGNLI